MSKTRNNQQNKDKSQDKNRQTGGRENQKNQQNKNNATKSRNKNR